MTLHDIQASPEDSPNTSLTELGRVIAHRLGWKFDESWVVCEGEDGYAKTIADITLMSRVMQGLGWINYADASNELVMRARAIIWEKLPVMSSGVGFDSREAAETIRQCIDVIKLAGWENGVALYVQLGSLDAVRKLMESGIDLDLWWSVHPGEKRISGNP